jgi:hypothetical protein
MYLTEAGSTTIISTLLDRGEVLMTQFNYDGNGANEGYYYASYHQKIKGYSN